MWRGWGGSLGLVKASPFTLGLAPWGERLVREAGGDKAGARDRKGEERPGLFPRKFVAESAFEQKGARAAPFPRNRAT